MDMDVEQTLYEIAGLIGGRDSRIPSAKGEEMGELLVRIPAATIEKLGELLDKLGDFDGKVDDRLSDGKTLLMVAVERSDKVAAAVLLDAGADPLADCDGKTPQQCAKEMTTMHIERDEEGNGTDGNTAGEACAEVQILIDKRVDELKMKEVQKDGELALVQLTELMKNIGDLQEEYQDDKAARLEFGAEELVNMVQAAGLLEKQVSAEEETLLMTAAAYGFEHVVELLLKAGADPDAIDTNGFTAMTHAMQAWDESGDDSCKNVALLIKEASRKAADAELRPGENIKVRMMTDRAPGGSGKFGVRPPARSRKPVLLH